MTITSKIPALDCPIDWSHQTEADPEQNLALLHWYHCCTELAVSGDECQLISELVAYQEAALPDDPAQLASVSKNLADSRSSAREAYLRTPWGALLVFLQPSSIQNGKHVLLNASREEIIRRSKNGRSIFYKDYSPQELSRSFWAWFADFSELASVEGLDWNDHYRAFLGAITPSSEVWRRILAGEPARIAFNVTYGIGATDGVETNYVCFDLNAQGTHAYPISKHEAEIIMGAGNVAISKSLY